MNRDPNLRPEEVRGALAQVLKTPVFARAERQSRFLRFVVERALSDNEAPIREFEIGAAVYDRPADYDPRTDPIVRVEASRLRGRLRDYYAAGGLADRIRFSLPKGTYTASITVEPEPEPPEPPPALATPEPAPPPEPAPEPEPVVAASPAPLPWRSHFRLPLIAAFGVTLLLVTAGPWALEKWRSSRDAAVRGRAEALSRQSAQMLRQSNRTSITEARHLAEAAIQLDPGYAPAWAAASSAYGALGAFGWMPLDEARDQSIAAAERALRLDPKLDAGYESLIRAHAHLAGDLPAALDACRQAIAAAPRSSSVPGTCANLQVMAGNAEVGLTWAREAAAQFPTRVDALLSLATIYFRLNRLAEMRETCERIHRIAPNEVRGWTLAGMADAAEDRPRVGLESIRRIESEENLQRDDYLTARAYLSALAQEPGLTADSLARLQRFTPEKTMLSAHAMVSLAGGDNEQALDWLEKGIAARDWATIEAMSMSTIVRPIRHHPRFLALAKKARLAVREP